MLITLRNSGADYIKFIPNIDDGLKYKILSELTNDNHHIVDIFLRGDTLSSFILDKTKLTIKNLHLIMDKNAYSGTTNYMIKILTDSGVYELGYQNTKPDFFKKLFKYVYPDMAEKQIEELV